VTFIKVSAEYPRPWWRRLLGLHAKRVHLGAGKTEPWPWGAMGQTPPGGSTNPPESGE
jgi:hypothetical protein